ncbi:MAG: NADP-dependent isocitrate dehydrogenase, partial [Spirochaetales bacterium]|nr:NADP-dependent isocitrate dehydrogenase [Spirochaetales bacterium]
PWDSDSKTHVVSMNQGDFYGSEISLEIMEPTTAVIDFLDAGGVRQLLKENIPLESGEIVDTAVMNIRALDRFLSNQMEEARREEVLFSIHLKATMMKVSDPVIFGRAVYAYCKKLFDTHRSLLQDLGVSPDYGLADLTAKIQKLPEEARADIQRNLEECFHQGPELAMVDSARGITNLHVPNDIIIDASMPAAIRSSGRMWAPDGSLKDMKAVIPDRTYAGVYKAAVDFCREHGALNPAALGTVSNIGLMAGKAEEYGSHDTTFVAPGNGTIRLLSAAGTVLMKQPVEEGDIFRMCRVRDDAVKNWVDLAVERARETGLPVVFWLDDKRPHDRKLIEKVNGITDTHSAHGIDLRILPPSAATTFTMKRMTAGLDTVSVTGNVLRDYLTDLFPILELGTSSKMLSIVPLLRGGRLFETGAGGSAPKHVRQFLEEGHLRWDSLGEFLALSEALHHLAFTTDATKAGVLANALERGTEQLLENGKSPSRNTGELDTRGSHFYLTLYWAQALAVQNEDGELKEIFTAMADKLLAFEKTILAELNETQGKPVDLGGYYYPDPEKLVRAARPSRTFNAILAEAGRKAQ